MVRVRVVGCPEAVAGTGIPAPAAPVVLAVARVVAAAEGRVAKNSSWGMGAWDYERPGSVPLCLIEEEKRWVRKLMMSWATRR